MVILVENIIVADIKNKIRINVTYIINGKSVDANFPFCVW